MRTGAASIAALNGDRVASARRKKQANVQIDARTSVVVCFDRTIGTLPGGHGVSRCFVQAKARYRLVGGSTGHIRRQRPSNDRQLA